MPYQVITFWPGRSVFLTATAPTKSHSYGDARNSDFATEMVAQVTWSRPYDSTGDTYVVAETSNDGQNWEEQTNGRFGPLMAPGTEIKAPSPVGMFQRFGFEFDPQVPPATSEPMGINASIVSLLRAKDPKIPPLPEEEIIAYLDAIRRGEAVILPPGAGRILLFLPRDTILSNDDAGSGGDRDIYTPPQPTHEFSQVMVGLSVDSFIGNAVGVPTLTVYPQISVDGFNWFELTAAAFTAITLGTSFPFLEYQFIESAAYMRFRMNFVEGSGIASKFAAAIEIIGLGPN